MIKKHDCLYELYKTGFVENYCKKISVNKSSVLDEIQDIWLILFETEDKKITDIFIKQGVNGLRKYASGVIVRALRGKNAKVRKKYDTSNLNFEEKYNYLVDEETEDI